MMEKTIKQLIQNRSFISVKPAILNHAFYKSVQFCPNVTDCNKLLGIFISNEPKIGIGAARSVEHLIPENRILQQICMISEIGITSRAQELISTLTPKNNVSVFTVKELHSNLIEHELMPKNLRILSEPEVESLLKKRALKLSQLPCILQHDPIVKFLGATRDSVITGTRLLGAEIEPTVFFRRVQ